MSILTLKISCDFQQNLINQVKGESHFVSNNIRMSGKKPDESVCALMFDAQCLVLHHKSELLANQANNKYFQTQAAQIKHWILSSNIHSRTFICIVHRSSAAMFIFKLILIIWNILRLSLEQCMNLNMYQLQAISAIHYSILDVLQNIFIP